MDQMVEDGIETAEGEAELRALFAAWADALERKDIEGLTQSYAPDVRLFDIKHHMTGVAPIRKIWECCLPCFPERFTSEHRDLQLTVSGDMAFAHGFHAIRPVGEPHPAGDFELRVTVCCRRIDGAWRVVHEHASVPYDCEVGKACSVAEAEHKA